SRSAQAVDEDRGGSIHTVRLENSERSVNTVRRVPAAPVVARPRGDFRGDRPEGRRKPVPDRLERRPAIPIFATCWTITSVVYAAGRRRRRRTWAKDGSQRMRKSQIEKSRDRIALSRFCYRRRKTLAPQGARKLPKLDVAGSTPVARSRNRRRSRKAPRRRTTIWALLPRRPRPPLLPTGHSRQGGSSDDVCVASAAVEGDIPWR